jgi:hypothetical protein
MSTTRKTMDADQEFDALKARLLAGGPVPAQTT